MLFDPADEKGFYNVCPKMGIRMKTYSYINGELYVKLHIDYIDYVNGRELIKRTIYCKDTNSRWCGINGSYIKSYTIEETHICLILGFDSFYVVYDSDIILTIIRQAKLNLLLK
jgi:hypothetical protein